MVNGIEVLCIGRYGYGNDGTQKECSYAACDEETKHYSGVDVLSDAETETRFDG